MKEWRKIKYKVIGTSYNGAVARPAFQASRRFAAKVPRPPLAWLNRYVPKPRRGEHSHEKLPPHFGDPAKPSKTPGTLCAMSANPLKIIKIGLIFYEKANKTKKRIGKGTVLKLRNKIINI
jgi:hypothetical protein